MVVFDGAMGSAELLEVVGVLRSRCACLVFTSVQELVGRLWWHRLVVPQAAAPSASSSWPLSCAQDF